MSIVFQFGNNISGTLGNGTTTFEQYATYATGVTMIMGDNGIVSCSNMHTALIDNNYNLYTCGYNIYGQLGLGPFSGQDYNNLTFMKVTGITGLYGGVKQVSCGGNYTAIIDENYNLYTCGFNKFGQLGLGETANFGNSNPNPYFMKVTGITGLYGGVKQVSCGQNYTAIIDENYNLYTCGYNKYGQLGLGSTGDKNPYFMKVTGITGLYGGVKQVSCGQQYTAIIDENYNLYTCGYNNYGQLGLGFRTSNPNPYFMKVTGITGLYGGVKQVSCGSNQTAILDTYDNLYTCGDGRQVGLNLPNSVGFRYVTNFTQVTGITGLFGGVKKVSSANDCIILLDDDNIYTTGTALNGRDPKTPANGFYPIEYIKPPNPESGFKYKWISSGSSAYNLFIGGDGPINCFSEGTRILSLNNSQSELSEQSIGCLNNSQKGLDENFNMTFKEEYKLVQDLQVGDFVKSYRHGYRKISKMLSGTFVNNPTDIDVGNCMYKMIKTDDNGLIDDVTITRNHGVLVERLSETEEKKVDMNNLEVIDGLISIIAGKCDNFEKVKDIKRYKYYHFSLETDGDNDRRFGVWANGLLVETPSNNMMDNVTNVKPLDF
jgi:alpha-tubulin suppressor-like RCC1 family protein